MKTLFIGGTGTISTACANLCINKGVDLWLINRGNKESRLPKKANYIRADINKDFAQIREILKLRKWDSVVDWTVFNPEQVLRDINLFNGKTKQFILISSASIYQEAPGGRRLSEEDPIGNSIFPNYALHKIECEKILLNEFKNKGFPAVVVRPGHTYAEFTIPSNIVGLGYGLVERIQKNEKIIVHDTGLSRWTLTHSNDFAVGFFGLLGLKEAIGEVFHITSSEVLTWLEIFCIFEELLGVKARFELIPSRTIYNIHKEIGSSLLGDKAKNLIFNNDKIKKFVKEFNPQLSFREGLQRSLAWHKNNPDKIYYRKDIYEAVSNIIANYESQIRNNEFSTK